MDEKETEFSKSRARAKQDGCLLERTEQLALSSSFLSVDVDSFFVRVRVVQVQQVTFATTHKSGV